MGLQHILVELKSTKKRCKFDTKSLKFHGKNTLEGNLSGWFLCGWFSSSYAF